MRKGDERFIFTLSTNNMYPKFSNLTVLLLSVILFMYSCKPKCGEPGEEPCPCPACPIITSLSPDQGTFGDEITLNGTNLEDFIISEDQVTINGVSALVTQVSGGNLIVQVPELVGTGPVIAIINGLGSDDPAIEIEAPIFTYQYDLEISSILPTSGKHGTVVTISGDFFSPSPSENQVSFNGVSANVLTASETELTVEVPVGAGSGFVSLMVGSQEIIGPEFDYEYTISVSTFAGSGKSGYADGKGANSKFNQPRGLTIDDQGNIFVSDYSNNRIRKVTASGVVTTVAGSGDVGFFNGNKNSARFSHPYGITLDQFGNLYVADQSNHAIRKVTPSGLVSTLAGTNEKGFVNGTGSNARFKLPSGIVIGNDENIYVADHQNNAIRKITPSGLVSTLAGNGASGTNDGNGAAAMFSFPIGLAVNSDDNIVIADFANHLIREITLTGDVTTLAGTGVNGFNNGSVNSAQFSNPSGTAVGPDGTIYVYRKRQSPH